MDTSTPFSFSVFKSLAKTDNQPYGLEHLRLNKDLVNGPARHDTSLVHDINIIGYFRNKGHSWVEKMTVMPYFSKAS